MASPRYTGLVPASANASTSARGSSRKRDTRCELLLRRALWHLGLRYRVAVPSLPGKPDIVLRKHRLLVFCDGDFWHGRDLEKRLTKLGMGHNASYWTAKIQRNVERDRRHDAELVAAGWTVVRVWETDILRDAQAVAQMIANVLRSP